MFITLEGIEGSGKSTLISQLYARLRNQGRSVLCTREPGGSALGTQLRPLLLTEGQKLDPHAELFLFLADRAQHLAEVIRPALAAGVWVLCDRYADSTIAYQGYGRGMDPEELQRLNEVAISGLWPDITLLLDLSAQEGLRRALARNELLSRSQTEGRFEAEDPAFHERVRQGFLHRAALSPRRFRILDATLPPEKLADQALTILHAAIRE